MGLIKYWCICKERCFSIKISSTWNLRQSIDIGTIPGYAGRIECTIRPKQIKINCQTPISKGMLEVVIGGPLQCKRYSTPLPLWQSNPPPEGSSLCIVSLDFIKLCTSLYSQTKENESVISCFYAKHAALRSKSEDWLARNQVNMSE